MSDNKLTKRERREQRRQEKENQRRTDQRKNSTKRLIIWAVVILILGGSIAAIAALSGGSSRPSLPLSGEITSDDHTRGDPESAVVLVEYSDLQCPACGYYYPLVEELIQEFGDQIAFVYRHFPLASHSNAEPAAWAAEAAGRQGKFWEMVDLIFRNQSSWSDDRRAAEIFEGYALQLELDLDQFREDRDSQEVQERVKNDYAGGIQSGVTYTPTFYLNGKKIQNPRSLEDFRNIIQEALNEAL